MGVKREGMTGERKLTPFYVLIDSSNVYTAWAGPGRSRTQELHVGLALRWQGHNFFSYYQLPPRSISRELDQKWYSLGLA